MSEWKVVEGFEGQEVIFEKKRLEQGAIARITNNRPQRMNALTRRGMEEIVTALDDASRDPEVGVVVWTGAGDKAFCTGGDVSWEAEGGLRAQFLQPVNINTAIWECQKPVIAAVKGFCIGGGNHWAYCCDLTLAADNAVFGQNGPRVASPADGFAVAYLTRVVGAKKAREIWGLCRQYTAQEAREMGLVNKVVPLAQLDEEVEQWCREVLALSPSCQKILKASFNFDFEYMRMPLGHFQRMLAPDHFQSEEIKEAQQAFAEKRPPNFGKFRTQKGQ